MQHKESLQYAPKLTTLPLSREAYNLLRKDEPVPWETGVVPKRHRGRHEIWKMKCFNNIYKGKTQQKPQQKRVRDDPVEKEVEQEESPPKKKTRFAERVAERAACVSPFDDDEQVVYPENNNTLGPKITWTKLSPLDAMTRLIGTGKIKTFVQAILEYDGPITFDGDYRIRCS